MEREVDRFRCRKIGGREDGRSCSIVLRSCGALALFYATMFAGMAAWAPRVSADPVVVVEQGLPQTVKPTFLEKGAPNFSYPTGGTGTVGGGNGGGPNNSGGANSGTGGYAGNGGAGPGTVASGYTRYLGQSVGTGQCVALAQATSNVGLTATWVPGEQVQGATDIPVGTVIATFGDNGTYTNTPGQSHTAIYLGQNDQGIQVMDQWAGQPAQYRTIRWTTSNSYESGNQFYVVSH
ncbi:BPSL0067 family protein [Methylocystis sp. IM4]|uniref:BPSL0067 family protein n=1 Tax=Methylocystis sp. IM4 TaxID=3136560 RepID=UPI003119E2F1